VRQVWRGEKERDPPGSTCLSSFLPGEPKHELGVFKDYGGLLYSAIK